MADADLHAAHAGDLLLPQRGQTVAELGAHPVAQEAGGQVDGDLVAIEPDQGHLAQPGAVFDFAHLLLQAAAHASPLRRHLLGGVVIHGCGMLPSDTATRNRPVQATGHTPAPARAKRADHQTGPAWAIKKVARRQRNE
jgi:hypothetical protein